MATRSRISIQNDNGTIDSIYCHWDGYPKHNGKLLMNHYATEEKIRELISLGGLSSLGEKPFPDRDSNHSYDNPSDGTCVAYHRDRGDELRINNYINKEELNENRQEWNYLYKNGVWYAAKWESEFKKLTKEMCKH